MIIDKIENAGKYFSLGAEIENALKFLGSDSAKLLGCGRHELSGKSYVSVNEYETKLPKASRPEFHKKYIDIQFAMNGSERIGYAPDSGETARASFDNTKDIGFVGSEVDYFTLSEGMFAIIFPYELHQPGISLPHGLGSVRKAVAKIETT